MAEMKNIKNIELGRFYFIYDGSESGHPGYIVWKNEEANLFLAIKIGTSKNKANRRLSKSLSRDVSTHYIYVRPFLGKRKDFGYNRFLKVEASTELIEKSKQIKEMHPVESKSINRKDRRNCKRLYRQK